MFFHPPVAALEIVLKLVYQSQDNRLLFTNSEVLNQEILRKP